MATKTVAVVGLGYVGLPVAAVAAARGWHVLGVDIDQAKVARVNQQQAPFADAALTAALRQHPITATTDAAVVGDAEIIIIAVPTPVTEAHEPDLEPLTSALSSIRPYLRPGQVVVVESTINPGVMDEVVVPLLRERPDLVLDVEGETTDAVHLIHCPERINPGDTKWSVRTIPRVLGGYTEVGAKKAKDFYESILDAPITVMQSVREAEAVKILENTFRDINIAFINEMAKSFDKLGIDITNVIAGATTKPFAFMPHFPGNGVGGHCISVDPYYMIERARQVGFDHEFLKLARHINDSMPAYTVELLTNAAVTLGLQPTTTPVALLGLAYKKNIDDIRESPALTVRDLLTAQQWPLSIFDPHVPQLSTVESLTAALTGAQAVMLACDHDEFTTALTADVLHAAGIRIVIDGKNALDRTAITNAGIIYHGVGRS